MQEIQRVLAMAGMTMDHLVSLQIFCSDVSLFDQFNAVYRTYFTGKLPARAFLGSGTLLFNARFELQGIAVKQRRYSQAGDTFEGEFRVDPFFLVVLPRRWQLHCSMWMRLGWRFSLRRLRCR